MFIWNDIRVGNVARAICAEDYHQRHGFMPTREAVDRDAPRFVPLARAAVLALHDPDALERLQQEREARLVDLLGSPVAEALPA